jgi:hypothetical protein
MGMFPETKKLKPFSTDCSENPFLFLKRKDCNGKREPMSAKKPILRLQIKNDIFLGTNHRRAWSVLNLWL